MAIVTTATILVVVVAERLWGPRVVVVVGCLDNLGTTRWMTGMVRYFDRRQWSLRLYWM